MKVNLRIDEKSEERRGSENRRELACQANL
jgi:hypothetical protein